MFGQAALPSGVPLSGLLARLLLQLTTWLLVRTTLRGRLPVLMPMQNISPLKPASLFPFLPESLKRASVL